MATIRAALIAVGTELIADGRPDTNGLALSRTLASRGVTVVRRMLIPDDEEAIAQAIVDCERAVRLVVVTGGLGPTVDDVTREGTARALGLPLEPDAAVLRSLEERERRRGRELAARASRQALVPKGAEVLPNAAGTAPGLLLSTPAGGWVVLLPGVPHEMARMMEEQVLPRLARIMPAVMPASGSTTARGFKVAGMTELQVEDRIRDLFVMPPGASDPTLSLLASAGEIAVIVRGAEPARVEGAADAARLRLGAHVFSEDLDTSLEMVVGGRLASLKKTIATAESCTGGLLATLLTQRPGASGWFLQGWVVYSNESKVRLLMVDERIIASHGAVSAEVAAAMACSARDLSGADYGIAITGIAGPDGGTAEKPVGLVHLALADRRGCRTARRIFRGDRETIRMLSARGALDMLRVDLRDEEPEPR